MNDPIQKLKILANNVDKQHQIFKEGIDKKGNLDQVGFEYNPEEDKRVITILTLNDQVSLEPFEVNIEETYKDYINKLYSRCYDECAKFLSRITEKPSSTSYKDVKLSEIADEVIFLEKVLIGKKTSSECDLLLSIIKALKNQINEYLPILHTSAQENEYIRLNNNEQKNYIKDFRSSLIKHGFIDPQTKLKQINRLFGINTDQGVKKITWIGSKAELKFFILQLSKHSCMIVPKNHWKFADERFFINDVKSIDSPNFYRRGDPAPHRKQEIMICLDHFN